MNEKLSVVDQQLLKTANRKQQNTVNVLWLVENCDIKFEILHKHNPFERITDPDNCDVRVYLFVKFFTWPRNYYNDNNSKQEIGFVRSHNYVSIITFGDELFVINYVQLGEWNRV